MAAASPCAHPSNDCRQPLRVLGHSQTPPTYWDTNEMGAQCNQDVSPLGPRGHD